MRGVFGIAYYVMSRAHFIFTALSWFIFAVDLLYFLMNYGSLPEEAGVHFSGRFEFDVYDSKAYGFYPFIITLIALVIIKAAAFAAERVKLGAKVTKQGDILMRYIFIVTLDLEGIMIALMFAYYWSLSVIRQDASIMAGTRPLLFVAIVVPPVSVAALIAVRIIYRIRKNAE